MQCHITSMADAQLTDFMFYASQETLMKAPLTSPQSIYVPPRVCTPEEENCELCLHIIERSIRKTSTLCQQNTGTHRSDGEEVVVQLPSLCGQLQRPLQVSAPEPQVHDGVKVTRFHVALL